jgi:hypothetical protein
MCLGAPVPAVSGAHCISYTLGGSEVSIPTPVGPSSVLVSRWLGGGIWCRNTCSVLFYAVLGYVKKGANCFNSSVLGLVGGVRDPVVTMAPFTGTADALKSHVFTDEKHRLRKYHFKHRNVRKVPKKCLGAPVPALSGAHSMAYILGGSNVPITTPEGHHGGIAVPFPKSLYKNGEILT